MNWHEKTDREVLQILKSTKDCGLSEKEARRRLSEHGKNRLSRPHRDSFLKKFLLQFHDFMILTLLFAALISFLVSCLHGDADPIEPLMILGIVVFNALLGVIQENRAERSLEALKSLTAPTACVLRENRLRRIPAEEIVPGDLLYLRAGDRVPADCRLLTASGLLCDESALTGEADAVRKDILSPLPQNTPTAERKNMLFASSLVLGGKGTGIAVETGMRTEVGKIAGLLLEEESKKTPLEVRLSEIGKLLGKAALAICAAVFLIGVLFRIPPAEMFFTSVSLAVAAIPEGLPAIVTILLAIGVRRMANQKAVIRNLPSVETLGSASVICSDKTGTLTENRMTVTQITGADPLLTLRLAALCSDADASNPTEAAILNAAQTHGISKEESDHATPRISETPFDSVRKRMTTLHRTHAGFRSITKGAPEMILPMCTSLQTANGIKKMTSADRTRITQTHHAMTCDALRVLAVAYTDLESPHQTEHDLVFVGMFAMEDPPRSDAQEAVALCKSAGIRPVMITGDSAETAAAIARRLCILSDSSSLLTGTALDAMSQEQLENEIERYSVFARTTPAHKVRIVRAWQAHGAVVAMTGDGVNDAPALKAADIGCSMGKSGTDVAQSASDMVLTDDRFATIVEAIRRGRGIYANIKKAVQFLLSSNIGEILTVFLGLLFTAQPPLSALQLLWVNLVTDSLPAIALGLDPPDSDLMRIPPRPRREGLFDGGLKGTILIEGAMIGSLALLAHSIGRVFFDLSVGCTMAFCVLSLSQLVHAFNMRSEHSILHVGFFSNRYLVGAFFTGVLLQVLIVTLPILSALFGAIPLNALQWGITALLSLAPLPLVELQKIISKERRHHENLLSRNTEFRKNNTF